MNKTLILRMKRWLKGQMLKRMPGMLTCREFEEFILAYFDDDLTERQLTTFKRHLSLCKECRDYLRLYERSHAVTRVALGEPDKPVPGEVPRDLIDAILQSKKM